jgi:COP9 signalosome complex subunit 6
VKSVHKDRGLDLVGWYTLLPKSGPTPTILTIHQEFLDKYNESSLLLGFHPEQVINHSVGGKLPMTIYESNYEHDEPRIEYDGEDKKMEDSEPPLKLKFRELPYSVETGEAEMISMDFIARGGGNATAVESQEPKPSVAAVDSDVKGKKRIVPQAEKKKDADPSAEDVVLSREEEEMIAALTARVNAIKMLHSRIQLITTYLEHLPASYLSPNGPADNTTPVVNVSQTTPSHTVLRSIQALVNRLDLLVPSDMEAFRDEMLREQNDVNLVSLLNEVLQSLNDARDAGKKFGIIENAKSHNRRMASDFAGSSGALFSLAGAGDLLV